MIFLPNERTLTTAYSRFPEHASHVLGSGFFRIFTFCIVDFTTEIARRNFRRWNCSEFVSWHYDRYGETDMARKSKSAGEKPAATASAYRTTVKWLNISLTDADYDKLDSEPFDPAGFIALSFELVADGGSIGVKVASKGDGFMSFLTRPADDDKNTIVGLAGYADTPENACHSLFYKYVVLLEETLNAGNVADRKTRRYG